MNLPRGVEGGVADFAVGVLTCSWTTPVLMSEFDRDATLPPSALTHRMMVARMVWLQQFQDVFAAARARMMAKAQIVRRCVPRGGGGGGVAPPSSPSRALVGDRLTVRLRVGKLGTSTFECLYDISCEQSKLAWTACVMLVFVHPTQPRAAPVPPEFARRLAAAGHACPHVAPDAVALRQATGFPVADVGGSPLLFRLGVVPRFADEDWNKHVNNGYYLRYFEEALHVLREGRDPAARAADERVRALAKFPAMDVAVNYVKEGHAQERCELRVQALLDEGAFRFHFVRLALDDHHPDTTLCTGWLRVGRPAKSPL